MTKIGIAVAPSRRHCVISRLRLASIGVDWRVSAIDFLHYSSIAQQLIFSRSRTMQMMVIRNGNYLEHALLESGRYVLRTRLPIVSKTVSSYCSTLQ